MNAGNSAARALLLCVGAVAAACMPPPEEPRIPAPELPPLTVEQVIVVPREPPPLPPPGDPLAELWPGRNVTLTAIDVDVRALLPALAEAADLSLVIGPDVQGRVTVNFIDVPALDAMRLVLEEAGLTVAPPPLAPPWGPVVFYALPVNIDAADRELIRARYRVSVEMAEWILETRLR